MGVGAQSQARSSGAYRYPTSMGGDREEGLTMSCVMVTQSLQYLDVTAGVTAGNTRAYSPTALPPLTTKGF